MSVLTFSSRDLTRAVSAVKRAAANGPVLNADHVRPAIFLLQIADHSRLAGKSELLLLDVMGHGLRRKQAAVLYLRHHAIKLDHHASLRLNAYAQLTLRPLCHDCRNSDGAWLERRYPQ